MLGNNINLSNLTFEPQTITGPTQTTHISFTKTNNKVYANGKTVEGILNISANGKTITKNISMSAVDVYLAGVNDAKANYISWRPTSPTNYNDVIATVDELKSIDNKKVAQVKFNLTAGHQISGSEGTSHNYTKLDQIFNIDVTDLINSGGTSGIDINDVRLYLTQASNVSDDYDTGISMTSGSLTYDPDNDRLIGYANAFLDTGTNTEQDNRRVKIIMSASKKPGSGGTISHLITKASGSNWSSTVKQYNFTVNDSDAGNVRIYKDGNIIKGAYANSLSESYSYDDLFTISSGGTTINTTGVNRVLSGSTYKEAYQSGNSWYIDVKPTVNGTEYTAVPINVSDVYTKGYKANPGTTGAWEIHQRYNVSSSVLIDLDDVLSVTLEGDYIGYDSNSKQLYGYIELKHGNYYKDLWIDIDTSKVPTGGDTPSSGSYARTGQNFYVDEQSYDYGYLYDGSSSKVAITGYVEVDGHRVWVNSFDIGVGSIWWDGYQNSGGGSEGVTIIDANGNSRTYSGGTVYISEIVKSSTQYGTTYAYQWGADGETPYVVSRYA